MKIIILILSGHDPIHTYNDRNTYKELQNLSRLYYQAMAKKYDCKYYFIEYNESITDDIVEKEDYIYIKGTEEFEKIYTKTKKSMQYIDQTYEYDYIVRTNISSFWNIDNLFVLTNILPRQKCLSGYLMFNSFISGTGIILSNDTCKYFIHQPDVSGPDDVGIFRTIIHYCLPFQFDNYYKLQFQTNGTNELNENIENILYFRIKNEDRTNDIICFKLLLKKIYNIDV